MPREFTMPELAESVVEGEIVQWLVAVGDRVDEDQPLVEVMTDKATVEIPSPFVGILEAQLAAEGDIVEVGEPIARFDDGADGDASAGSAGDGAGADGAPSQAADESGAQGAAAEGGDAEQDDGSSLTLFKASDDVDEGPTLRIRTDAARGERGSAPRSAAAGSGEAATRERPRGPYGRVLAVPAARKLAREEGIDIETVEGSGPNGRIRKRDVEDHVARGPRPSTPGESSAAAVPAAAAYRTPEGYADREERTPLRGLRRMISKQMVASHLRAVRTLHVDEADVSGLVALRAKLKPMAAERGVRLSYLPFIMKAVVAALREYPMLNASLDEQTNEIVTKRYYNLGMAVATDQGLVVPVIKDVDRRSLLEVADEVQRLAEAARTGSLAPDEVKGGTFSITNIGSLGGLFSFPIINLPDAAILGVHTIKKRPVVVEHPDGSDEIVARPMLYLSNSFDHRLVDGAEAAMFTSRVIEILETPESLMLDA